MAKRVNLKKVNEIYRKEWDIVTKVVDEAVVPTSDPFENEVKHIKARYALDCIKKIDAVLESFGYIRIRTANDGNSEFKKIK